MGQFSQLMSIKGEEGKPEDMGGCVCVAGGKIRKSLKDRHMNYSA